MGPDEAFAELGLTAPLSADRIRRAYLKAVRVHPPERDPQGFQLVREAYELLKDAPWLWHAEGLIQLPASGAEPQVVQALDSPLNEARAAGGEELREATAPAAPAESWSRAETNEVHVVSEDEEDETFEDQELTADASAFYAAMRAGELERAARGLLEEWRSSAVGSAGVVAPWSVFDCVLGLFASKKCALASKLLTAFEDWNARQGGRPGEIPPTLVARWTLLRELRSLRGKVDAAALRALARAVKSQQFFTAASALERAAMRSSDFEQTFRSRAPSLYAATWPLVMPTVGPHDTSISKHPGWGYGWAVWLLIMAVQGLPRACGSSSDTFRSTPPSTVAPRPYQSTALSSGSPTATDGSAASNTLDLAFAAHQVASVSRELDAAVVSADCDSVREQWPLYIAALDAQVDAGTFAWDYHQRRTAAVTACPQLSHDLPEQP